MDDPGIEITQSEKPARLACPANEGPDTIATLGAQPESSAMPSNN